MRYGGRASGINVGSSQPESDWNPLVTAGYNTLTSSDLLPSPAVATFDTAILTRTIAPVRSQFSPEVAAEILRWDFSSEDQREMANLSAKARAGTLPPDAEAKIDSYIRVSHIVNLLQAKARLAIKQTAGN